MSDTGCSYEILRNFTSIADKCTYVKSDCHFEYFSILTFNYCYINDNTWITFILLALIIFLCFYFLSSTGNDYLAPALGIISEKLHLSQNLAGLTLLALGNQAPDVVVAFVAGDDDNEGVETSLGSLLGGGMIVVSLVFSTVVYLGKEVNVVPRNFVRDLGIYFFALVYILILGKFKAIKIWQATLFFCFYILYVIVCFIMDKKTTEEIEESKNEALLANEDNEYTISLYMNRSNSTIQEKEEENIETDLENTEDAEKKIDDVQLKIENNKTILKPIDKNSLEEDHIDFKKIVKKSFFKRKATQHFGSMLKKSMIFQPGDTILFTKFRYDLYRNYLNRESKWENKNVIQKILFIILDLPLNLVRDLTIPAYEKTKWNRSLFIIQPICISCFLIVIFRLYQLIITYWIHSIVFLCFILTLCIVFYRISYRSSLPSWHWLLLSSSFVISILWLWFITNILIDMIVTVKLLLPTNLPQSFLSITVLAFGNSLPDFIVNTSLARSGYAEMALSGSIGAPLFGILFGFGLSLGRRLIRLKKEQEFDLFNFDRNKGGLNKIIIVIAITSLLTLLFGLIIGGFIMDFKIKRRISFFGYCIYTLFFLSIIYFIFIHDLIFL